MGGHFGDCSSRVDLLRGILYSFRHLGGDV